MKPQLHESIRLDIQRLGVNGEGVGAFEGLTFFVDGALPGETVRAQVIELRKNFGRALLEKVLQPSSQRVTPVCPLFGRCGGCQVMHLAYDAQLMQKTQRVIDAFERIGKLKEPPVFPCHASPQPLSYRNKIQLPVRPGPQGELRIGLFARNTHDLVDVEHCYIHSDLGEKVYQQIRRLVLGSSLTPYDVRTQKGELRYILIKSAVHTGQILVIFVTACAPTPALRQVAQKIAESCPEVKGIIHNLNTSTQNAILGPHYQTLLGQEAIEEVLSGLHFRVSPASFFQVNPGQAENLYAQVLTYASLSGQETVLDAYCGVGTLSLFLAQHARKVIGVECVAEAIADAKLNAARNQISSSEFHCAAAEDFIKQLEAIDIAVLNPPRKGCEPSLLQEILRLRPRKVIYVSCDPATLARDTAILCEGPYKLTAAQPFDMFPQTAHVETVALLSLTT